MSQSPPDPTLRMHVAPTLARYPTEYQWQELEELLRQTLAQMPYQSIPEALVLEPASSVLEAWRDRHWLCASARWLP